MKLFVTVESFQCVIEDVKVHATLERANECEQDWLEDHEISDEVERNDFSDDGTEFLIFEYDLND